MALKTTRWIGLSFSALLAAQHFQHVPGDRLALAVGVGGEDHAVGVLHGAGDVGEALGGLGRRPPIAWRNRRRVDRAVLGRQVADMAEGGQDLVVLAEVLVDRLGLGRRFDDDDSVHERGVLQAQGPEFEDKILRWKGRPTGPPAQARSLSFRARTWAAPPALSNEGLRGAPFRPCGAGRCLRAASAVYKGARRADDRCKMGGAHERRGEASSRVGHGRRVSGLAVHFCPGLRAGSRRGGVLQGSQRLGLHRLRAGRGL